MTPLFEIIQKQITRFGPMNVADYMSLCLLHPEHGYYVNGAPIGPRGDFITSPEISQMFGELIGLCLVQTWLDQGRPDPFLLVEPGPGNGTLMADILRASQAVPGFAKAAEIWLVEVSNDLKKRQSRTLGAWSPNWASKISDLPDKPIFLCANEFFDTLPIRQFEFSKSGWQERMVGLFDGNLQFGLSSPLPVESLKNWPNAASGDVVETSAAAQSVMSEIATRIASNGGMALVVDYGHWGENGDTFQSVGGHQKTDPLANPGQNDLTAHVDFSALARAAPGVQHSAMIPQGVLLERLGITERARALATALAGDALETHIAAHRRLTHPDEMGNLFKAMAFTPNGAPQPPGFEPYAD